MWDSQVDIVTFIEEQKDLAEKQYIEAPNQDRAMYVVIM